MICLICISCTETGSRYPQIITPILIAQGELYGNGEEGIIKQNLVIRTQQEWDNLLNAMNSVNNVSGNFAETEIDFNSYIVIAVFDEIRGNSGCSINIAHIIEYIDSIVVDVHNVTTTSGYDVMNQPYYIVKIPATNKNIVFGCNASNDTIIYNYCECDNPLDLPCLSSRIQAGSYFHMSIYQCVYSNGEAGFLIEDGYIKVLFNCNGNELCAIDECAGETTCSEFNIVSQELIWERDGNYINTSCTFTNPLTDLLWLRNTVDRFNLLIQREIPLPVISIYQCIYGNNQTGFLIDEGNQKRFFNCNGQEIYRISMPDLMADCYVNCHLNIVSQELIWQGEYNPVNLPFDPNLIVGRWRCIASGNWNTNMILYYDDFEIEQPIGGEFTADGRILYDNGDYETYSINEEYLYEYFFREEPNIEGRVVYKHKFYNDKVRLEFVEIEGAFFVDYHINIYQKVE